MNATITDEEIHTWMSRAFSVSGAELVRMGKTAPDLGGKLWAELSGYDIEPNEQSQPGQMQPSL